MSEQSAPASAASAAAAAASGCGGREWMRAQDELSSREAARSYRLYREFSAQVTKTGGKVLREGERGREAGREGETMPCAR